MEGMNGRTAVYTGTFDPIHNGHVSLVRRALQVFDRVILAVARDTSKDALFSLDERVDLAKEVFADSPNVTVEFVQKRGANVILRGLRAVSDFEYEFQMALMNRRLLREVQTVFFMTDYKWLYISSSIIKEAARHGGNIKGLVPDAVVSRMYSKYAQSRL